MCPPRAALLHTAGPFQAHPFFLAQMSSCIIDGRRKKASRTNGWDICMITATMSARHAPIDSKTSWLLLLLLCLSFLRGSVCCMLPDLLTQICPLYGRNLAIS